MDASMARLIFACYLVIMNIAAFALFAEDKRRAKKDLWRIPEKTLIALMAVGGSLGGLLAMEIFRHKTTRLKFWFAGIASLIIWTAAAFIIT